MPRRIHRPAESLRQSRCPRRIELSTAAVGGMRADLVPPKRPRNLRLTSSLSRLVRHDQRRVDRSDDNGVRKRSQPLIDLVVRSHSAGLDQPAGVVDHGNARPRPRAPCQVDADEAWQERVTDRSLSGCLTLSLEHVAEASGRVRRRVARYDQLCG